MPSDFQHSPREEGEDLVHPPGVGQAQANGAVEGVLAHPDVVALPPPLQVDRAHQIDFVQLVGPLRLGRGVDLTGERLGQAHAGRGDAVALEHALDGAQAGEGAQVEGLELGEDRTGPDQAVARPRAGVALEASPDGQDGALQLGRDACRHVAVGSGQVEQAVGAEPEVAAPPLVEPGLGAADGVADLLDRAAGEAESNGSLPSGEFVVHGCLRRAAACGCLRR